MSQLAPCPARAVHRPGALGEPELCAFLGVHLYICIWEHRRKGFASANAVCPELPRVPSHPSVSVHFCKKLPMFACSCVRKMPASTCTCVSVCLGVNPYICQCACLCMCLCVHACVHLWKPACVYMRVCVLYVYSCALLCVNAYVHVSIHAYVPLRVHVCYACPCVSLNIVLSTPVCAFALCSSTPPAGTQGLGKIQSCVHFL